MSLETLRPPPDGCVGWRSQRVRPKVLGFFSRSPRLCSWVYRLRHQNCGCIMLPWLLAVLVSAFLSVFLFWPFGAVT